MHQDYITNDKRHYFQFQWNCLLMIIIVTMTIMPSKTTSMIIHHSHPSDNMATVNVDDDYAIDYNDPTLAAATNYHNENNQRYLNQQLSNPYQYELIKYPIQTNYKRGPAPLSSSARHSPSFSFNGDMRLLSNLRHMMSGGNPLTAFG
ncbi:hypothetical protein EWB00_001326 [Schistosoma japonicum]|uniref:SJCHGC03404 protein n=1 Tax=Schistosoma japonicum TaxID=6182 RepID=Q5DEI2_SCHJA|nr:SJCHGC03404 protein [Schistosoma japonicum]TNN15462.1 hypothetical protein EWB00_001326 [Schistosoma japonicum]